MFQWVKKHLRYCIPVVYSYNSTYQPDTWPPLDISDTWENWSIIKISEREINTFVRQRCLSTSEFILCSTYRRLTVSFTFRWNGFPFFSWAVSLAHMHAQLYLSHVATIGLFRLFMTDRDGFRNHRPSNLGDTRCTGQSRNAGQTYTNVASCAQNTQGHIYIA